MNFLLAVENFQLYLILLGVIVMFLTLTRRFSRRSEQPGSDPKAYAREQIARIKDQQVIRGDMEELLVQIQELSRQINAQLDNKFTKLEIAVRDADQRITLLQRLLSSTAPSSPPQHLDTLVTDESPLQASKDALAAESAVSSPAAPPSVADDPVRQRIYTLADTGKSSVEIAVETGQSTGEIELLLALRRSPTGASSGSS